MGKEIWAAYLRQGRQLCRSPEKMKQLGSLMQSCQENSIFLVRFSKTAYRGFVRPCSCLLKAAKPDETWQNRKWFHQPSWAYVKLVHKAYSLISCEALNHCSKVESSTEAKESEGSAKYPMLLVDCNEPWRRWKGRKRSRREEITRHAETDDDVGKVSQKVRESWGQWSTRLRTEGVRWVNVTSCSCSVHKADNRGISLTWTGSGAHQIQPFWGQIQLKKQCQAKPEARG